MRFYGGAAPGDRTMLDALTPAVETLERGGDAAAAARAARNGADATARMVNARAGRSSYLAESELKGVADPGAVAIAVIFEAASLALARARRAPCRDRVFASARSAAAQSAQPEKARGKCACIVY